MNGQVRIIANYEYTLAVMDANKEKCLFNDMSCIIAHW